MGANESFTNFANNMCALVLLPILLNPRPGVLEIDMLNRDFQKVGSGVYVFISPPVVLM